MVDELEKLYGVVLNQTHNLAGGECKIYAIQEQNKRIINDFEKINSYFPNGNIYSGKLFNQQNQISINDLIEIPFENIGNQDDSKKSTYILHQPVKKIGCKIIEIPFETVNDDFLDVEQINEVISDKNIYGKFYLSNSIYLFGPFKINNQKITPAIGKSVNKYNFNVDDLIDIENASYSFLIEEPKKKIAEIDCMTKTQVLEHLKTNLIKFHDISIEVNKIIELKNALSNVNTASDLLNSIRLQRANKYLSELELSYDEINKLKSNNEYWEIIFNENYQKHKSDFEKEFLKDVEATKKVNEKEIENLKKEIVKNQKIANEKAEIIEKIATEIEQIKAKKDDLILSLRLSAGITETVSKTNTQIEKIKYFLTEENLNTEFPIYEDCDDYLDDLTESRIIRNESRTYFIDSLYCLKNGNFYLANNICFINTLIKSLGVYKMIQQNTEIDWIKYEYLFENGLKDIAESAVDNPTIPHFYVLQDINLASFECYAKPVIDLANKVRNKIPGINISWPTNLYFIGIPIEIEIDDFGFELQSETFKNWKAFPKIDNFTTTNDFEMNSRVEIKSLQINYPANNHLVNYF